MSKRVKPDPGQQCECPSHPAGEPPSDLRRVYYEKRREDKFCYEWWCQGCYDREGIADEEWDDGWPTGEDGRFKTPVHCPVIPGLD